MAAAKRPRTPSPPPSSHAGGETASSAKLVHLSHQRTPSAKLITCSLPHTGASKNEQTFASYAAFDEHYAAAHTNLCLSPGCGSNFPSPRYLELHLAENHDPIVAERRARGEKVFKCFEAGCDKVCMDWRKRRAHLVDKHGFPREFDFWIVNTGTNGRRSLLRTARSLRKGRHANDISKGKEHGATIQRNKTDKDKTDNLAAAVRVKAGASDSASSQEGSDEENNVDKGSDEEKESEGDDDDDDDNGDDKDSNDDGHDEQQSSANAHQNSRASSTVQRTTDQPSRQRDNGDVGSLTQSMSALTFVPPSVRFGRGGGRLARR